MLFRKKYYFLSGIPRSGNTLLGSLLNQNKNISVTANSIVSEMLYRVDQCRYANRSNNFLNQKSHDNVCNNIIKNYYRSWKSKVIIDRTAWGTPDNLELLQKYCPNEIKIIVLFRDIEEVLASYIKWSKENPNNFLDQYETIEEKCEILMNPKGLLMQSLLSAHNLLKDENRKYALFITYDDLVNKSKETTDKIYNFLKIKNYNHNFKDIKKFSSNEISYDDSVLGDNLHRVREGLICREEYDVTDYIPNYILDKYRKYNVWKDVI